jgi:hypothetical protein
MQANELTTLDFSKRLIFEVEKIVSYAVYVHQYERLGLSVVWMSDVYEAK